MYCTICDRLQTHASLDGDGMKKNKKIKYKKTKLTPEQRLRLVSEVTDACGDAGIDAMLHWGGLSYCLRVSSPSVRNS